MTSMQLHSLFAFVAYLTSTCAAPLEKRDQIPGYIVFKPALPHILPFYLQQNQQCFTLTSNTSKAHIFTLDDSQPSYNLSTIRTGTEAGNIGIAVDNIYGMNDDEYINYGVLADVPPTRRGSIGKLTKYVRNGESRDWISQSYIWNYDTATFKLWPTWVNDLSDEKAAERSLIVFVCPKKPALFVASQIVYDEDSIQMEQCGAPYIGTLKFEPIVTIVELEDVEEETT